MVVIKDRTVIQDLGTDFFRDIDQNAKGLTIFRGAVYNTSLSFRQIVKFKLNILVDRKTHKGL